MKKLLITGGGHAELPLIQAAQTMGYYVISTGNDEGNPGHLAADKYMKGDFSDKEFVLELARREQVDAIVSGCNDFAYLSTAYACEKLGLPGHDSYAVAETIHIKSKFRQMATEIGIKMPKVQICRSREQCIASIDQIGFPLLVKPVDLTGGKGVQTCYDEEQTLAAFEAAMSVTRQDYVILEQFVQGVNHGITTLLKNGKVVFHMVDNEQYGMNKYLVLGACAPSNIPQFAEFTLLRDIEKIAAHCKLTDGLFHAQFILDEDNYPVIIDPCRRAPGDLYILLASYVTQVDYPAQIVMAECGMELPDCYPIGHNFVARECIMTTRCCTIRDVEISSEIVPYIVHSFMRWKKGDVVEDPMKYKAGILIMRFDSYEKMMWALDRFDMLVRVVPEEGE